MTSRLFRVYLSTVSDESIRELIVTANDENEARERALEHVKSANQGKGDRSKVESEGLTTILAVHPTSKRFCVSISAIPAAAVRQIADELNEKSIG